MSIDTQAYLFVHFIGEERNPTDEQLYFALSRDGVHWRSAPGRQSGVDVARRREGRARPAYRARPTWWIPHCGHRFEHLLPWRLGAERWRHHEWIDRPGDLGLP